jgi:hypothetical protein
LLPYLHVFALLNYFFSFNLILPLFFLSLYFISLLPLCLLFMVLLVQCPDPYNCIQNTKTVAGRGTPKPNLLAMALRCYKKREKPI